MKIDFSGSTLFLEYLEGQCTLQRVIEHPAYQTVFHHAARFSDGMKEEDIEDALSERSSPFYGLKNIRANLEQIRNLWKLIETRQADWVNTAQETLSRLFPAESLKGITIYPILGYDMGIGINEIICMNMNVRLYLEHPEEFLYFMIHEFVHVLYERSHHIPVLRTIKNPAQWESFFKLMFQNEGYAVYAPWRVRQEHQHFTHYDYQILQNPENLNHLIHAFSKINSRLQRGTIDSWDEFLALAFGPSRLTYRVGGELLRRIEMNYGLDEVTAAFYMDGEEFMNTYKHLLE